MADLASELPENWLKTNINTNANATQTPMVLPVSFMRELPYKNKKIFN
jgi:hypothetical protein